MKCTYLREFDIEKYCLKRKIAVTKKICQTCPKRKHSGVVELASSVANIARNPRLATEDLKEKRVGICEECQHYTGTRCMVCGCFISLKIKFQVSKCPIGSW